MKKITILFTLVVFSWSCHTQLTHKTVYKQNQVEDQGKTMTYQDWVDAVGPEKAAILYSNETAAELDALVYGAGQSNVIQLVNLVTDATKLAGLIGNGSSTGLGATRILSLLNRTDNFMTVNISSNLTGGGAVPADTDTIGKMGTLVENVDTANISKIVTLIETGLTIDRGLVDNTEQAQIDKVAKLLSHLSTTKVTRMSLLINDSNLSNAEMGTKLGALLKSVNNADRLLEVIENLSDNSKVASLVTIMDDASDIVYLRDIINASVSGSDLDGTKLAYLINNVAAADMVTVVNGMGSDADLVGNLLISTEDGSAWTSQVYGPFNWGNSTKGEPASSSSTMVRLKDLINNVATKTKLVDVLKQVNDMNKLVRVIQDVQDPTDLSSLINNLSAGAELTNLGEVMNNVSLTNIPRLRQIVDGQRINGNTGTQIDFSSGTTLDTVSYIGKLKVLISNLSTASEGPLKVSELIDGVSNSDKVIDLVMDVTTTTNLSNIINNINKSSSSAPNQTAVRTLVYLVENVSSQTKLVSLINNIQDPADVSTLVNNVAAGSQLADDGTTPDLDAAGKKLAKVIDNVTTASNNSATTNDLVFLLNNVQNNGRVSGLINNIIIGSTNTTGVGKVSTLVNDLAGASNTWSTTSRGTQTKIGKLVNLIDYTNDNATMDNLSSLINNVSDINKMTDLVNNVSNSSNMVGLLNAVLDSNNSSSMSNLTSLVNGIDQTADMGKLVQIVNQLPNATEDDATTTTAASEHDLVAQLLGNETGSSGGVGSTKMVSLIQNMGACSNTTYLAKSSCIAASGTWSDGGTCSDNTKTTRATCLDASGTWTIAAATKLTTLLNNSSGINTTVTYKGSTGTAKREALVRMIAAGADDFNVGGGLTQTFPGLGTEHVATLVNGANSASDLVTLINSTDLGEVIIIIGCGDRVTGFQTACGNIGQGW